jgi:chitodextrinase
MSSSRIDLSWQAASDNISGITGYRIYSADTNTQIATTTSTSHSLTGLSPNTSYSYYVKAYDVAGNLSGASTTASATTYKESVFTSTGSDVSVDLGNGVNLNFSQVTGSGSTSITLSYTAPSPPPGGFSFIGYFWDVTTTASFAGTITVTFPYDETQITGSEENLRLFHWENGAWQDVTVLPVDTVNNRITGEVTSLSPFGIAQSQPSAAVPSASFWALVSIVVIGLSALWRSLKRRMA